MTIYYSLRVRCTNCYHKQTARLKKGMKWQDSGWLSSTFKCEECGCRTLVRCVNISSGAIISVGDELTEKMKKAEEEFMHGSWKRKKGKK